MAAMRLRIDETKAEKKAPRFAPAGQSTQMIVGADGAADATILGTSATLYANYNLKRIYYSAFSPIPDASSALPAQAAPLAREHRLYQADWLFRFYGFAADEITAGLAGRHARSRHRSEARLGAAPPRPLPDRREQGQPRGAAAHSRTRHQDHRPADPGAAASHAAARRSGAAGRIGAARAAVHRHRRSPADARSSTGSICARCWRRSRSNFRCSDNSHASRLAATSPIRSRSFATPRAD